MNYRFYPGNYVAYDWWKNEQRFADRYTPEQKEKFQAYIEGQLAKINLPNKDTAFLLDRILAMYANPLINYLEALQHED